jgi:dolichol-phosphate mannosyltransferase
MLSIVIPVYNEAESLAELYQQLRAVAEEQGYDLDVVFVDDGSTDASWPAIRDICRRDAQVRGIRFRRNFGKAAALSAGFAAARAPYVITLDADLQDDPREIPKLLAAMEQDLDVVSGWKQRRHDPWHKVWPSRVFNWMVSRLTGVVLHDHNCGFKCYRREVLERMRLYGELHRFIPVLAAAQGWRVGEVVIQHRPRVHGHSKYGLLRIPKGFLDLLTVKFLTGYGQRPQHLLGAFGLACFTLGTLGILVLTVWWVLSRTLPDWEPLHLTRRAIFFYCLGASLLGGQFMSVGFLAEMMTALHGREADTYAVAERAGGETGAPPVGERPGRRLASAPLPVARPELPAGMPHIKPAGQGETSRDML